MMHTWRQRFVLVCIVIAAFGLHMWLHRYTMSFIVAPIAIAALLPYVRPSSASPVIALIFVSETFTTLPLGIMSLAIITPFLARRAAPRIDPDLSFSFFALIAATVASQIAIIIATELVLLPREILHSWQDVWYSVPAVPAFYTLLATSAFVYATAIAWRELIPTASVRFTSA